MTRLLAFASLAIAASNIAYAASGDPTGGPITAPAGGPADLMSARVAYIVHKEGQPDTLQISPSGRILNDLLERPEWDGDVVLALLNERNDFYHTRLGAEMAAPLLTTNLINYDDLSWVAVDEDTGLEMTIPASDELRQANIAQALGLNRETGDIEGSINEVHIELDASGYTAEELAARNAVDEAEEAKPQRANGTLG
jgi:hypothetical protein